MQIGFACRCAIISRRISFFHDANTTSKSGARVSHNGSEAVVRFTFYRSESKDVSYTIFL
eukprot:IDg12810t1